MPVMIDIAARHAGQNLQKKPLEPISKLAPFSALIISITMVIFFLIRYYILEGFLIKKLYGRIYTDLNEVNRRGFVNHHIAGITKLIILFVAAYPFVAITFGKATFNTPFAPQLNSIITMGDMLIVVAQMLIGMYVFELIYRSKLSPVAVMHHIGTIIIGQSAIAISLKLAREPDADIEFILCTVWGTLHIFKISSAPGYHILTFSTQALSISSRNSSHTLPSSSIAFFPSGTDSSAESFFSPASPPQPAPHVRR